MVLAYQSSIWYHPGMAKHKTFAEQLKRIVTQSKLTRYQIYQRTGINQAQLSRFVNGKGAIGIALIEKLTELFRIELSSKEPE
ncbi:MAG: helix-turn-helix transcriptional regulator [Pirellulales bacterium]|nr:helix-turn-helix transcriptional regulator [Pirellulales bacterium]